MSIYQFACAVDGYNESQRGSEEMEPPTAEEFEEAKALYGD